MFPSTASRRAFRETLINPLVIASVARQSKQSLSNPRLRDRLVPPPATLRSRLKAPLLAMTN